MPLGRVTGFCPTRGRIPASSSTGSDNGCPHECPVSQTAAVFCVATLEFCWIPTDGSGDGAEIRCLRSLTCQQPSVQPCLQSEIVGLLSKPRRSQCQPASSRCKSACSRRQPAGFHRCGLYLDENTLETTPDMLDSGAELPFLSAALQKSSAAGSSGSENMMNRCDKTGFPMCNTQKRIEKPEAPRRSVAVLTP